MVRARVVADWMRSPGGVLGGSVLVTVVLAVGANLALDVWQVGGSAGRLAGLPIVAEPALFVLGSLVVWLFVLLTVAVLGRLWVSVGLVVTATVLVGFANYRKQQLLMEPLYPSDLAFVSNPGFVVQMAGVASVATVVGVAAAVLGAAVVVGRWLSSWFRPPQRRGRRGLYWTVLAVRLIGGVVSVAAIAHLTHFHQVGNVVKATYDEHGAHWRAWHQSANYNGNGFVAGMLYNMPLPAMRRPRDYGPATMQQLVTRYAGVAHRINSGRDPGALQDVNVVFLLGEAFSDPTRVRGVELAEDPIPFTRSLMQRTTAGSMWSPKYGGGTANVEFEALTGMSLAQFRPQMTTPYQMLVPNHGAFPSVARFLSRHGHDTLALHSFTSALYRRAEVYPILGFDDADFADEMSHTATLEDNQFVSDRATFNEVLSRLEGSERPMFLNVVTMQNHYPMAGKYADPIDSTGLSDSDAAANLEHYARGLAYSDDAMRHLVRALDKTSEKTVVVFYGDHLPAVWPASVLTRRVAHQTPFFVYANFGEPMVRPLPTTSAIYFTNHVLEAADAAVSPYYALLQRLEQHVPAMGHAAMIGPDNEWVAPQDLPRRARRLLHDYRLVQYDLSVGQRYSQDAMFDPGGGPAGTDR